MTRVHIHLQAELSVDVEQESSDTPDDLPEMYAPATLTQTESVGEVKLQPVLTDAELFTDSELHELFEKSDHEYKFVRFLLSKHPYAQEVLDSIDYPVSELDITVTDLRAELKGESADIVQAAAASTENPDQALLSYATLNDSCFRNLSFTAEQVLEDRLTD